jgi:hypothetical protein
LLTLHIAVFALMVALLAAAHLFLIRREGPVHPIVDGGQVRIENEESAR